MKRLFLIPVIVFAVFVSITALGANVDQNAQRAGTYVTEGESHYEGGAFTLESWDESYLMKANLIHGDHLFDVEIYLDPVGNDHYRGSGFIFVRYENGTGCRHRFGAKIYFLNGELFLRENTPRYIPFNPYGPCTGAGVYEWFNHEAPYVLID